MFRPTFDFPATGVNRRWLRSMRVWLAVGCILAVLVAVWAYRAFQVGPLLFPPPAATTTHQSVGSPTDWPAIRRDAGSTGWAPGAAPSPPFTTLWEYDTPGAMLATPAVVGDRVFITTEDGVAAALTASTGETLWTYAVGSPSDSAPAIAGNTMYLGARDHRILALDHNTGRLLWERNLGNIVLASPIVVDGTVYIGSTNGRLEALDAATGASRWSAKANGWVVGHPASDGAVVAATSLGERFITVAPDTGRRRLVFFSGTPVVGGPIIADGRAYFVTNRGGVWAVNPTAVSRPFSRFVYVAKFNFFAWRLRSTPPQQTGSLWVSSARGRVKYSPVYADGRLFVVNEANKVTAFAGATGEVIWESQLEQEVVAEPVAAGNSLILGTIDGVLHGLDTADGRAVWQHEMSGSRLSAAPAVSGGTLYVPTADGRLVALAGRSR